MSLTNLKRKLASSLRPAPQEQPAPPHEQAPWAPDEDVRPTEGEDDFEGDGWSFWGV